MPLSNVRRNFATLYVFSINTSQELPMKKTASLSHLTSSSALLAGQPRLSNCEHAGIGCDECALISEPIPCKPTGRRRFIRRQRKVDGQMESFLVLIKGKPGGQTELRRNSKPRRSDNAVKLAYLRRMDERAAQEAIAEALGLAQSGPQDSDGEWTAKGAAYCHMTDAWADDSMFDYDEGDDLPVCALQRAA